jgi:hypothetical protein
MSSWDNGMSLIKARRLSMLQFLTGVAAKLEKDANVQVASIAIFGAVCIVGIVTFYLRIAPHVTQ